MSSTREYSGKVFLAISAENVLVDSELSCGVYVHLPRNGKMVRIRDAGQVFDSGTIALYQSGGHTEFYVLDPKLNPDTYDVVAPMNPPLPAGYLPMDEKAGPEPSVESPALVLVKGEDEESAAQVVGADDSESDPGIVSADYAPEADAAISIRGKNRQEEKRIFRGGDPDAEGAFVMEADGETESQDQAVRQGKFGSAATAQKIRGSSDPVDESEQRFSQDPAEKEERMISRAGQGDKATDGDDKTILAWESQDEKDVRQIRADIEELQGDLIKVEGGKEFVEELQKIAAGETEEEDGSSWRTTLSDDSPKLQGLDKGQAATAKLSFAVNKRLGQLRRELSNGNRFVPDAKTKREDIQARRKLLQEDIRKCESTLVLLESLDDDDFDTVDLPPELKGKDKIDLVRFVAARVEEMRGTSMLREEDYTLVQGRIESTKAKNFQVFGEGITRIEQQITKRMAKAKEKPIDAKEAEELRTVAVRELKAARASANIAKKLTGLRSTLSSLLGDSKSGLRSNPKENAERERKAMQIQMGIREMENLALQVDSGQSPDEARLTPFLEPEEEGEKFFPGEATVHGIGRILVALGEVKGKLVAAKMEAADSEADLAKQLDGESGDPAQTTNGKAANAAKATERELKEVVSEQEAQADFKTLVSGRDGKELQSGVYAAALLRFFGYRDESLERELVTACYLYDFLEEQLVGEFNETVLMLHKTFHNPLDDESMCLRDLSQAVRMARSYNEMPGVITGKFAMDPLIFSKLCDRMWTEKDPDVDYQLVERARQRVASGGQSRTERDRLIQVAKGLSNEFAKWRHAKAASERSG